MYIVKRMAANDWNLNATNSHLDLSPLYGLDGAIQNQRMLAPPAVITLLVILGRNRNYIAERLLSMNEQKRWMDPARRMKLLFAPEIFQFAWLINQIYLTENIVLSLSKTTLFRFQTLHEPHRRSITTY
ncbi:hypothetical protein AX14_011778 [Amanita brunnescens Koide BX004]|nr:hypothetical protein AX14_011778 [Amanita brunnescens Koide BX004]